MYYPIFEETCRIILTVTERKSWSCMQYLSMVGLFLEAEKKDSYLLKNYGGWTATRHILRRQFYPSGKTQQIPPGWLALPMILPCGWVSIIQFKIWNDLGDKLGTRQWLWGACHPWSLRKIPAWSLDFLFFHDG